MLAPKQIRLLTMMSKQATFKKDRCAIQSEGSFFLSCDGNGDNDGQTNPSHSPNKGAQVAEWSRAHDQRSKGLWLNPALGSLKNLGGLVSDKALNPNCSSLPCCEWYQQQCWEITYDGLASCHGGIIIIT